jgi:membrane-bound ClpP family serine protease
VKKHVRLARFFCVVGIGLLIWGISDGSIDRGVLGAFLLILGIAGYVQEKKNG